METSCAFCHRERAAKRCTRCKAVRYCGPECQKKHWHVHRAGCRPWSDWWGTAAAAAVGNPFGKEEPSLVAIPDRGRRAYPREIDGLLKQWNDNSARNDQRANEEMLLRVIRELDSHGLYRFMEKTRIRPDGGWFVDRVTGAKTAAHSAFYDAWRASPNAFLTLMRQRLALVETAKARFREAIAQLMSAGGTRSDAMSALKDVIDEP